MHPLDIAILGTVGFFAFLGLWRGLIKTILPLLGLFLGITLGGKYGGSLSQLIFHSPAGWQNFVGFIIVVLATLVGTMLIARLLTKFFSWIMLGWLDRVAGLFIGALLGLFLWAFALTIASQVPVLREFITSSAIASFILRHFSTPGTTL